MELSVPVWPHALREWRVSMSGHGSVCSQRFEYKYVISEAQAEGVTAWAMAHLEPDVHADRAHHNEYMVQSLYLDTDDLSLYHDTVVGKLNRFKLRVRWYDDQPDTPAFLEIKARRNDVIEKARAPVRKKPVERIMGGFFMSPSDLDENTPETLGALGRFCEMGAKLAARPVLIVRYRREAYIDPTGRPVRLTVDRDIKCLRAGRLVGDIENQPWLATADPRAVLEVKFTDTFPNWARDMVQALNLMRTSAAKYVRSVDALAAMGVGMA